jgi:two-component system sensor histidine kinase VanS
MGRNASGDAYSQLKRKLVAQSAACLIIAAVVIGLLYFLVWRENAGDALVWLFERGFGMTPDGALYLYNAVFRQNAGVFFAVGIAVVFLVLIWIFSKNFTRYFDAINGGIDALLGDDAKEITLMPEMAAIEGKLNAVRLTLEQRAQAAQQAEERKDEMVMYLAHDIRTPLTSVIGYLSLLAENPSLSTEQRARHLGIALEKAHRLEELISELFEITRLNSRVMPLQMKDFDLSLMLRQLADEFYPQLQKVGRQVDLSLTEGLRVTGDTDRLARAFANLLRNAIAYSEGEGPLEVAALCERDKTGRAKAVVAFRNPGTIPQNELKRVFEKFYRRDSARATDKGGSGLGLAIAAEIIALHNGSIRAESQGGQTTFIVELPVLTEC